MKTISIVSALVLLAAGMAGADVPRKVPSGNYAHLWNTSPFTSKPPPATQAEPISAFDDWALSGVSEVNGGYLVTLQHKKNQAEWQVIKPDRTIKYSGDEAEEILPGASGAFKVDRVEYKKSWMDTVVHLSAGGRNGTVKFDEKTSAPKMAAAAPQRGGPQGNNPQAQPNPQAQQQQQQQGQPQQQAPATPGVRPPRPRGNNR
jgi:hypothetical protein